MDRQQRVCRQNNSEDLRLSLREYLAHRVRGFRLRSETWHLFLQPEGCGPFYLGPHVAASAYSAGRVRAAVPPAECGFEKSKSFQMTRREQWRRVLDIEVSVGCASTIRTQCRVSSHCNLDQGFMALLTHP